MLIRSAVALLLVLASSFSAITAAENGDGKAAQLREAQAREAQVEEARRLFQRELGDGAIAAMDGLTDEQLIQQGIAFRQLDKALLIDITESRMKRIEAIIATKVSEEGEDWEELESHQEVLARVKEDLEQYRSGELPLLSEKDIDRWIHQKEMIARFDALRGKWNASLVEAISGCDRIRFLATGFHYGSNEGKELYQLVGHAVVDEFISRTQVVEPSDYLFCMCAGDFVMEFYSGENLNATLSFHHGKLLRWLDGAWTSDAELTPASGLALQSWVSEIGYPGVVDFGE